MAKYPIYEESIFNKTMVSILEERCTKDGPGWFTAKQFALRYTILAGDFLKALEKDSENEEMFVARVTGALRYHINRAITNEHLTSVSAVYEGTTYLRYSPIDNYYVHMFDVTPREEAEKKEEDKTRSQTRNDIARILECFKEFDIRTTPEPESDGVPNTESDYCKDEPEITPESFKVLATESHRAVIEAEMRGYKKGYRDGYRDGLTDGGE